MVSNQKKNVGEPVSAFAVYSGLVNVSKTRKRKKRKNKVEEKISVLSKKTPLPSRSKKYPDSIDQKNEKTPLVSQNESNPSDTKSFNQKKVGQTPNTNQTKLLPEQPSSSPKTLSPVTSPKSQKTQIKKDNKKRTSKRVHQPFELQKKHFSLVQEAKKIVQTQTSSETLGKEMFMNFIHPHNLDDFLRNIWEKKPLLVSHKSNPFKGLITTAIIDELVRKNIVMYGKHVDVTSYSDGVRETHNPEGRVHAHVMWDYYSNGCSIRFLNPQYFLDQLHHVLATLQEFFGCMVGANAYLTPPDSQGFAPHYDDIEAFVVQTEGKKHWRVYEPREHERLPSFSSPNFTDEEIGNPILEVTLEPGDVLYFPRGFIHQANTVPGYHSLHVTISTYQKTAWSDLLEKALPFALKRAATECIDYRRGLPLGFLRHAGLGYPKVNKKKELLFHLKKLISKLEYYVDIDAAVDQMGVDFIHDSMPPVLNNDEVQCSVFQGGITCEEGVLKNRVQLEMETKIRLIRAYSCRIVFEDVVIGDTVERQLRLYHNIDNSREYHGEEPQFLVLPLEFSRTIQQLVNVYPTFIPVQRLHCDTDNEKITIANDLWERGLLVSDSPLKEAQEIIEENGTSNFQPPQEPMSETEESSDSD